jgi:hypothetical protein
MCVPEGQAVTHASFYSYYKTGNKSCMTKELDCDYDKRNIYMRGHLWQSERKIVDAIAATSALKPLQ